MLCWQPSVHQQVAGVCLCNILPTLLPWSAPEQVGGDEGHKQPFSTQQAPGGADDVVQAGHRQPRLQVGGIDQLDACGRSSGGVFAKWSECLLRLTRSLASPLLPCCSCHVQSAGQVQTSPMPVPATQQPTAH